MKDKLSTRIKFLMAFMLGLMAILFLSSFKTMIINGEAYRVESDTKRIKDVYTKAARGDILDRNGKVLATSKNQFVALLHADDLTTQDRSNANKDLAKLASLLEEDGVTYTEESPLTAYYLAYKNDKDYIKNKDLPVRKLAKTIVDKGLVEDFLLLESSDGWPYSNLSRAISVLEARSQKDLEVKLDPKTEVLVFKNTDIDKEPMEYLLEEIGDNTAIIETILAHPMARKLTFDLAQSKALAKDMEIKDLVYTEDIKFLHNKAGLAQDFKGIDFDSEPKDDFIKVSTSNLDKLLIQKVEAGGLKPGEILIKAMEKDLDKDLGIDLILDEDMPKYSYKKGVESSLSPLDALVKEAKAWKGLGDFLTSEDMKFLAQEANTQAGDTPNISVLDWSYIFIKNKSDFLEKYKIKEGAMANQTLVDLREYYEITIEDSYQAQAIANLNIKLDSQGYRAFEPVVLSYGLKKETVARIEEQVKNPGIEVDQIPVRFYPNGQRAAHVLGYIGKIAQDEEIETYVKERGYQPSDLIGKTGVEESFEETLRGRDGKKAVQIDSVGNTTNVLSETPPVKGNSLYLSLDMDLQKVAEESLAHALDQLRKGENFYSKWGEGLLRPNESEGRPHLDANSGSVVVLDVKTGEVLALANEKTYDPNLFARGISQADWDSLFPEDDKNPLADRPLLNVAMQTEVSPGSIFKLCVALAGLENGMDPHDTVNCTGYIDMGDHRFGCWIYNQYGGAHGYEDVIGAIRDSCNYYFYGLALGENPNTGEAVGTKLSVEDIREYAIKLGLEDQTGVEINIPFEASGQSPNPEDKKTIIKYLLAEMLDEKIEDYIKDGITLNPDSKKDLIKKIVDLVDGEDMDYYDLEAKLEDWGLDMTKTFEASDENIAERIKYTYLDQAKWNITDMLNIVIGQGQNAYTPLQMANYVSTIANGGFRNKLTLINKVTSSDGYKVLLQNEAIRDKISLKNYDNLNYIKTGMNEASHFGTLETVFGPFPVEIGLKTGTAERAGINPETGRGFDDYSWMIAFAPYDDPQIAICTLLYQAGSGSNGAPIIREIVGQYLGIEPEDPYLSYEDLNNGPSLDKEDGEGEDIETGVEANEDPGQDWPEEDILEDDWSEDEWTEEYWPDESEYEPGYEEDWDE